MHAQEKKLVDLLMGKQQLTVPIYQRTYSWKTEECEVLWDDIKRISENTDIKHHFIGSIVRIKQEESDSDVSKQTVIDGQQRISTISLLICALIQKVDSSRAEELREDFLINRHKTDELRYKLLLTQQDRESLKILIDGTFNEELDSFCIKKNYEFFVSKLKNENADKILNGISRLMVVDISLDPKQDNPQIIFESLNSTGRPLSQADLIHNYVLMRLTDEQQNYLYRNYWKKMKKDFGQTDEGIHFNSFMRHYLTIKTKNVPKVNEVYDAFKRSFFEIGNYEKVTKLIADIYRYSAFYTKMVLLKETDKVLLSEFNDLKILKVDVAYPFLLQIYSDYDAGIIDKDEFSEVISIIQSYVFRRSVCGLPTNSLNKIFPMLHNKINQDKYILSLKIALEDMIGSSRFPKDNEFYFQLIHRDMFHIKHKRYWLSKYENFDREEQIEINDYSVYNIIPQDANLSSEWQEVLGEDWIVIHQKYINTLGNIAFACDKAVDSKLPFNQKKSIKGGFNDIDLRLNKSLQKIEIWNEESIIKRAKFLANQMLTIWKPTNIGQETIDRYKPIFEANKILFANNNSDSNNQQPLDFKLSDKRTNRLSPKEAVAKGLCYNCRTNEIREAVGNRKRQPILCVDCAKKLTRSSVEKSKEAVRRGYCYRCKKNRIRLTNLGHRKEATVLCDACAERARDIANRRKHLGG